MGVTGIAQTPLVHIGFYKSASTWLQKFLFLPELGFQQLIDPFSLHARLVQPAVSEFEPAVVKEALFPGIVESDVRDKVPVISCEALSGDLLRGGYNRWQNADRVQQVLAKARILLVVREQGQLIRSMYKTMVLFGLPYSVNRLLRSAPRAAAPDNAAPGAAVCQFDLGFIRFDTLAEYYASLYGRDAVMVLPYELFSQEPLAFITRVYAHCGRDPVAESLLARLPLRQRLNPGESLSYIHLQRWINRLCMTRYRDYAGLMGSNGFDQVLRRIAWHKKHARETVLDAWLEQRFAAQLSARLPGAFAASNRQLQAFCPVALGSFAYEM